MEFRFFTRLRTSEMVGLQWSSIDWVKHRMLVREAVVRGLRKQTKTNQVRIVSLNSRAFAALAASAKRTHTKRCTDSQWPGRIGIEAANIYIRWKCFPGPSVWSSMD